MFKLARKLNWRTGNRFSSTPVQAKHLLGQILDSRTLLRFHGKDVLTLLQKLVTNDVAQLRANSQAVYAMFLNRGGKVICDSIIYRTTKDDTYLVECDRGIMNDLKRHSRQLKGRDQEIEIESLNGDFSVWTVYNDYSVDNMTDPLKFAHCKNGGSIGLRMKYTNPMLKVEEINEEILLCRDPRIRSLGTRVIVPQNFSLTDINKLFPGVTIQTPNDQNDYKLLRYKLGVGEGIEDHTPGKVLPMESNCDFLNGFCFKKTGFVGQENTATTIHTSMIRKRIMPLSLIGRTDFSNINIHMPNGKHIGKLLAHKDKYGIALLRVDQALEALSLLIDGIACETKKPIWWPGNVAIVRKEISSNLATPVGNDMENILAN